MPQCAQGFRRICVWQICLQAFGGEQVVTTEDKQLRRQWQCYNWDRLIEIFHYELSTFLQNLFIGIPGKQKSNWSDEKKPLIESLKSDLQRTGN